VSCPAPGSLETYKTYTTRGFSFVWIETERRDGGRLSGKRGKPRGQGEDEGQGEGGDGGEDDDAYLI